ncbi:hypothetical protein CMK18_17520 [Candidatus Poribacteria bacterium]|nr:hypothetical protein [Candidatus Poribacteria bacterium]
MLRQSLENENERVRQSTAIHVLKATGFYDADWRVQQLENSMDEEETEMERLVEQFQMVGAQIGKSKDNKKGRSQAWKERPSRSLRKCMILKMYSR